ncbi:MAG: aminotransferase class V-fold PLP-dependent enzyme [Clostridium sp.]|uniref:aminotransferase class V-fold PLP-dependent enzyme n=1 Tax=Clostridium sp. TaxID=1506 RepID=UPI003F3D1AC9
METKKNVLRGKLLGIESKITLKNGKKVCGINFDNAATTPPLKSVVEYIEFLSKYYASIGRGAGQKATFTTDMYNSCREYLLNYFGVQDKNEYTAIFINNTTDGINKIADTLLCNNEIVLSTRMEHHSNDLPWRKNAVVDYVDIDEDGRLDYNSLEEKLNMYNGRMKFLSVTGASNVTGYMNDIHKISKLVHKYGGKIIVDGAQLVPHRKVEIGTGDEEIDFLVFSGHKFYAPFGSGAIICKKDEFEKVAPDKQGGGTVELVKDSEIVYLDTPEKNEAGTPNFFGVVSMVEALKELDKIGFDNLFKREEMLFNILNDGLISIPNVVCYGDTKNRGDRLGIDVFNINGVYHKDVAKLLADNRGIAVRHGWFCAHPYCRRLMNLSEYDAERYLKVDGAKMYGMVRVSIAPYNTRDEVYCLLNEIEDISKKYGVKA